MFPRLSEIRSPEVLVRYLGDQASGGGGSGPKALCLINTQGDSYYLQGLWGTPEEGPESPLSSSIHDSISLPQSGSGPHPDKPYWLGATHFRCWGKWPVPTFEVPAGSWGLPSP